MRTCRLHITGASGSGTTTLGRSVADTWAVPHADADDYYWLPTVPPFRDTRPAPDRVALMERVFVPRSAWVLSGSMTGWGAPVLEAVDAVVFLTLAGDERLRRIEAREDRRYDGAVDPAAREAFLSWARAYDDPAFDGRSRHGHEAWLASLRCPVLRLDSAAPVTVLRDAVLSWEPATAPG